MIQNDQEAAQELVDISKKILSYKRVVKKKRPQRGKDKMDSRKLYKKNRNQIKKKQKKYRKRFKKQLQRTRGRHSSETQDVLRVAKFVLMG